MTTAADVYARNSVTYYAHAVICDKPNTIQSPASRVLSDDLSFIYRARGDACAIQNYNNARTPRCAVLLVTRLTWKSLMCNLR